MKSKAFELIEEKITETLSAQGFTRVDGDDSFTVFKGEASAIRLSYNSGNKKFELSRAEAEESEISDDWKTISVWLFDESSDSINEAESIANDFVDTLSPSKKVPAALSPKKKKKKDDDSNADPVFFFNRLVNIFPELREDLNAEKITYGDVRPFTFAKEKIVPKINLLCDNYSDSDVCAKMCDILSDMYTAGDLDTRAIITYVLINSIPEETYKKIAALFKDDLLKEVPSCRRLIGKTFKPEKKKKQSKIMAESLKAYSETQNRK